MKLISSLPEYSENAAAQAVWARLDQFSNAIDGIAYYKHPIITSAGNTPPDFTLLAKGYEPCALRVYAWDLDNIQSVGEETWGLAGNTIDSPILEIDDFCVALQARFDRQRSLRGKTRPVGGIVLSRINRQEFIDRFGEDSLSTMGVVNNLRIIFRDDDYTLAFQPVTGQMGDDEWRLRLSVFQGVFPLNKPRTLVKLNSNLMGDAIKLLNEQIALLDDEQQQVAIQLAPGPQRIRGLAGTGKTVVLAMKAANIHLHYPDKKILFTFNTQSLYQQIERLITQFYRVNGDVSPNWEVLHVRHGWGSARRPGVYSDACRRAGVRPLSFSEAKAMSQSAPFKRVCEDILKKNIQEEYDFVLVDEAQDFPPEFFKMLAAVTKEPKRIYFAYDEMQSLTNLEIPSSVALFGARPDGTPIVDIEGDPYPGDIERDFVLHRSYRCPRDVLLVAHGIGLGIHSPTGCVQMLGTRDSWESVGYLVREGAFHTNDKMVLERPSTNSPNPITQIYDGTEATVTVRSFDEKAGELEAVAEKITWEVNEQGVKPEDIVVICLDARHAKRNFQRLQQSLDDRGILSTIPGLVDESWEFTHEKSVTLSTVYRAKGNEAPVVHLISFEAMYGFAEEVEDRNKAFASLSRAKGWLRIYGSGKVMLNAQKEVEQILADSPNLKFVFPNMDTIERKLDAAETTRRRRLVKRVKRNVADILSIEEAALRDLDPEALRLLREKLGRVADEP